MIYSQLNQILDPNWDVRSYNGRSLTIIVRTPDDLIKDTEYAQSVTKDAPFFYVHAPDFYH